MSGDSPYVDDSLDGSLDSEVALQQLYIEWVDVGEVLIGELLYRVGSFVKITGRYTDGHGGYFLVLADRDAPHIHIGQSEKVAVKRR